jgi:hypothetical protein
MIESDTLQFRGKYRDALKSAFVRHGVLSLQAADALTTTEMEEASSRMAGFSEARGSTARNMTSGGTPRLGSSGALSEVSLTIRGLGSQRIKCQAPTEQRRFMVASAAIGLEPRPSHTEEDAATSFVEDLVRRGRVDVSHLEGRVSHPFAYKTHELVGQEGGLSLLRLSFDCGFDL